ncbi:hypothetical protein AB0N65_10085 [Paenarthrobacter sp. NPDC089322]|uniref:hypothetical protein n=1 Tax=Paenarthrobacter sp. NPDC089322 TaxID=3155065 RepID=UPI00343821CF
MTVLNVVNARTATPLLVALEIAAAPACSSAWPWESPLESAPFSTFARAIVAHLRVGDSAVNASAVLLEISVPKSFSGPWHSNLAVTTPTPIRAREGVRPT